MTTAAGTVWSAADRRAVDLIRVLAMDAVEQAGSGHPGTAMSLAPAAYLLFQEILRHDPADPGWLGRDRFVLSCGHSSLTLYLQFYLSGYGLTLDDIRALRTWGSLTPGHPEYRHTPGVETTTGPLGQGLANAVGMAMAARRERGLLDPDTPDGASPFDHYIYVFTSDGDIEEGISHETSSLAGHQELGRLIVVYDDNTISIEDDTAIAKSEDVCARYAAYGWHVQRVNWRHPDGYAEDVDALRSALIAARDHTSQPSFISLRTIIGWPAPTKQNTGEAHGAALGAQEVAATKRILGFDPEVAFPAEDDIVAHTRLVADRSKLARAAWEESFASWAAASPDRAALLARLTAQELPSGWAAALPSFPPGSKAMATRKASGEVLTALAGTLPELWGGFRRPGREQQHDHGERAVLHPGRAPDPDVPRQPVRPHPAFRHPGACHGRGLQRDRGGRADPALRRHVPGVQRLHAARGPAGGDDAAAGDLRLDTRLHRPR